MMIDPAVAQLEAKQTFAYQYDCLRKGFEAMVAQFIPAFQGLLDALITAIAPIQNLLDHLGVDLRDQVCPHHAIALRGGRCPRCDRHRR